MLSIVNLQSVTASCRAFTCLPYKTEVEPVVCFMQPVVHLRISAELWYKGQSAA